MKIQDNIIYLADSYKLCHWSQYPKNTQRVFSYLESRKGAKFDKTVFFGLQYIIKRYLVGQVVTQEKIDEAAELCKVHFGNDTYFNREGWEYILKEYNGYLPIKICAVPEGSIIPVSNILISVENTDDKVPWLTNFLESLISQVWYSNTVCTLSREVKNLNEKYLLETGGDLDLLDFKLHDFGFRGASSVETAGIGGMAHLVNHKGTDTVVAMQYAQEYYGASLDGLAYSVAATEHSIMTALGDNGEEEVVENLLNTFPTGILSVVADSYNIYNFVDTIVGTKFKEKILNRDGVFVVRPDSVSKYHPTPESEMVWIMESLWAHFSGHNNIKGYKVINPKVRVLWGDGIDIDGIELILEAIKKAGFAAENIAAFGMGGGLLQKVNRDTQRFAFKSSAQERDGVWYDISKNPLDATKASKRGRLKLIKTRVLDELDGHFSYEVYKTVLESESGESELVKVFEDGKLLVDYTFDEIRKRAKL